jgi:hypothetical protein
MSSSVIGVRGSSSIRPILTFSTSSGTCSAVSRVTTSCRCSVIRTGRLARGKQRLHGAQRGIELLFGVLQGVVGARARTDQGAVLRRRGAPLLFRHACHVAGIRRILER